MKQLSQHHATQRQPTASLTLLQPWLAIYAALAALDVLLAATVRHDVPRAALFALALTGLGCTAAATARYWPALMRVELRVLCGLASLLLLHLLLTSS